MILVRAAHCTPHELNSTQCTIQPFAGGAAISSVLLLSRRCSTLMDSSWHSLPTTDGHHTNTLTRWNPPSFSIYVCNAKSSPARRALLNEGFSHHPWTPSPFTVAQERDRPFDPNGSLFSSSRPFRAPSPRPERATQKATCSARYRTRSFQGRLQLWYNTARHGTAR